MVAGWMLKTCSEIESELCDWGTCVAFTQHGDEDAEILLLSWRPRSLSFEELISDLYVI